MHSSVYFVVCIFVQHLITAAADCGVVKSVGHVTKYKEVFYMPIICHPEVLIAKMYVKSPLAHWRAISMAPAYFCKSYQFLTGCPHHSVNEAAISVLFL